jgi:hypothetical protein
LAFVDESIFYRYLYPGVRIMRRMILFSLAAGVAFAGESAANAQAEPAQMAPAGAGAPRVQDMAASRRQFDNDYNILAGRGVEVTNMDRADQKGAMKRPIPVAATASDVVAGAPIRDIKGVPVGLVATLAANEVADPDSVVVDTGQTKVGVPLNAFGKDDKGLMLGITAANFKQLVAQANTQASASQKSN